MTQFKPIFRRNNLLQLKYALNKLNFFFLLINNPVLIKALKILSVKNYYHSGIWYSFSV